MKLSAVFNINEGHHNLKQRLPQITHFQLRIKSFLH